MQFQTKYGLFFVLILTFLVCSSRMYANLDNQENSILIVCSYNPAAHQSSVTISDFMDEYRRLGGKCDIIIENMNCKSFSEAAFWQEKLERILEKYQGKKQPKQLILLGQEAWATYLSLREKRPISIGDVPVMCSLVSCNVVVLPEDTASLSNWMPESLDLFDDGLDVPELKSGFLNEYDIEKNIRLVKAFYPDTRHIVFISDNTYGGVAMQALVRKEMKKFPKLNLISLDGRKHTIYTIVDELRHLPSHSVILIGTWRVDMNEGYFMRNATYSMMEACPDVPTFTPSSVSLGNWAIGGVIPDYRSLGKDMAKEVVWQELHPNDTSKHISVTGSQTVLDYAKQKEWALSPDQAPFEITIVNAPVSFYKQYEYQIWIVCSAVFLLILALVVSLLFYFRTKYLKDELQHSEQDLRIAKDRAEESNRLKSSFLANMSHEIRTPLNSIVGFSDVLAVGGNTKEEQQAYVSIIKTNSDLLLRLINDILDISRLEANRVLLKLEKCDVVLLCERVVATLTVSRHSDNRFVFQTVFSHFELETDVQRLQQVLINLLSNADKFTENGVITLSLDEDGEMARFSVSDTGCGIPVEKQKQVFERFEKLNEYAQGTGLGLSICKLLVRKWGGEIWIDPKYSKGARFVFSHPLIVQ